MKRKYIIPQIWITKSDCLTHFLAGSGSGTGGGNTVVGGGDNQHTTEIKPGGGNGLIQHSKQFDAWASWDE